MVAWTRAEFDTIAEAEEIQIRTSRVDGSLRKAVTIWVVAYDGALYVRSANGPDGKWYQGARSLHRATVSAAGVDRAVDLIEVDGLVEEIDRAYAVKYSAYATTFLLPLLTRGARNAALRLDPIA